MATSACFYPFETFEDKRLKASVMRCRALLLFGFFSQILRLATSQFEAIDAQLAQINSDLLAMESKVRNLLWQAAAEASQASATLKRDTRRLSLQQSSVNLTASLDDLAQLLTALATVDSYPTAPPLTSCADAGRRLIDCHLDVRRFDFVAGRCLVNLTRLTNADSLLTYRALLASLSGGGAANRNPAAATLTALRLASGELQNYMALLQQTSMDQAIAKADLVSATRRSCVYNNTLPEDAAEEMAAAIEENLGFVEDTFELVDSEAAVQTAVLEVLEAAESVRAVVGAATSQLSLNISRLVNFLRQLQTVSDYETLEDVGIETCVDLASQVGFLRFKEWKYLGTRAACAANRTATADFLQTLSKLKLTEAQMSGVKALSEKLRQLNESLSLYWLRLDESVAYMARIMSDVMTFADFYCSGVARPVTITKEPQLDRSFKCALWARFLYDDAPAVNGFSASLSDEMPPAYVGRGYNDTKNFADLHPGRLDLGDGLYIEANGRFVIQNAEYLVVRSNCDCFWFESSQRWHNKPKGLVTWADSKGEYAVGRKVLGNGSVVVSRVDLKDRTQSFLNEKNRVVMEAADELLACESGPLNERPVVKFAGKACAYWAEYELDEAPTRIGLDVGLSPAEKTLYVGRGIHYDGVQRVGRVQPEPSFGVFVPEYEDMLASEPEYLVVPKGCTCQFRNRFNAVKREGLVVTMGNEYVGLKALSEDFVAISRVDSQYLDYQQYMDADNIFVSPQYPTDPPTGLLVCEVTPPKTKTTRAARTTTAKPATGEGYPCALWAAYANNTAPQIHGFSAGVSPNKSDSFIARNFELAFMPMPGRVHLEGDVGMISVWFSYHQVVHSGEYLVRPVGCTCSWLAAAQRTRPRSLVTFTDDGRMAAIGRYRVNKKKNRYHVTRVDVVGFFENYFDKLLTPLERQPKEWLVCESQEQIERPVLRPFGKACGVWTPYNNDSMPAVNGFAVGRSIMNNTAYVGRAYTIYSYFSPTYATRYQRISRLQIEEIPGVYLGQNGDDVGEAPEYLVVPEGCKCAFVKAFRALRREGLVSDITNKLFVGRKDLGDGFVAVTEVDIQLNLLQTFVGRNFFEANDTATELLVCEFE